ncbi:hypothetical protein BK011_09715 [Tenericutes bacterium MZ-XQ]|jgi:aminoglycoside phosphotransferase (APT) family kinase protein|nr:hypothetical protein BK011_09715 [Tenericutes bacterium MZ-XQ]
MKININHSEHIINQILSECNLDAKEIEVFQSNDRVCDYLVNQSLMLRISEHTLDEVHKLLRLNVLQGTQRVYGHGCIIHQKNKINYMLLDFFHGSNLYDTIPALSTDNAIEIGKDIAKALKQLHQIKGDQYDIGHYIPTIPKHRGSWKSGHQKYISLLHNQIKQVDLSADDQQTIALAFKYMYHHIDSLNFEEGPVILHNDLHPKNIIINQNRYVGMIDWECSQYGSYDFEFTNLIHWCIYPMDLDRSFETLLKSILDHYDHFWTIPMLAERFTIYQLEHEINQIIWNQGNQIEDRIRRINGWLSGLIHQFFDKIHD